MKRGIGYDSSHLEWGQVLLASRSIARKAVGDGSDFSKSKANSCIILLHVFKYTCSVCAAFGGGGASLPVILEVHENVNMQNLNPNLLIAV
jgi:hypothetical protein